MPKTIVLDFDGFLHTYESGWTGPKPTDPPVAGAREFVDELVDREFDLVIVSSRAETKEGCAAITDWLIEHDFPPIRVTYEKVQGDAYIDDRAVPFRGDFDKTRADLDELLAHPKWWTPRAETPVRECAGGCGLAAAPGDIYCEGCRDGVERERPHTEVDR